jgi:outer membrane protein assembly factor BamB/subtilisin family serine protease
MFLVISLLCGFLVCSTMAQQFQVWNPPPVQAPKYVQGEIVVKFKSGVKRASVDKINQEQGATVLETNNTLGFMRLKTPEGKTVEELVAIYSKNPNVEYAEPNFIVTAYMVPNDPMYPLQWHLDNPTYGGINMQKAWDISTGSSSVIVAVIDTGIAYEDYDIYRQAPDLAGTTFVPGYDFINGDSHPNDDNAHGTHVTGTIAQTTNNGYGVAGVAFKTAIMPVKVLARDGYGSYTAVANGIQYAADNGAKVINMSLGGPSPSSTLENAVKYAYNKGVTIVASAGNDGRETVGYPAAYEECIAVGATRYDEAITFYSNYGSEIDLVAPGGDPYVDQNGDGYPDGVLQQTFNPDTKDPTDFGFWFFVGTSMAAPHVSGVAALVIAKYGDIGPDKMRQKLQTTAEDHGTAGWDKYYGWGIVDAHKALEFSGPDIAITPISYDYGGVKLGEYKDKTFVVKSCGTELLSVISTTLIGDDASEFSIQSGGGSFDLNPGETRDVVVRFEPQSAGDKNATLRFISNDPNENPYDVTLYGSSNPDISVTPTSYDYGYVKVGEHADNTFVVKNEGFALLSVNSTALIGDDASEFSIQSGGGSFDLNPNETRDVVVRFEPQSFGDKKATLRFISNDPNENPYDVPLSGSSNPDISVTPTSYDYGYVKVGEHADNTFVVKNEGSALLSVNSTVLIGDDASEFSIQSGGGSFDLNPNETRDVVVRFEPQSFGDKKATLRFVSNDPDENQFDVTLSGTGSPLKWKFQTGGDVYSSPAIGLDGTIYVGSNDYYLYAINPDGTEKWKFQTSSNVNSSPAIGSDGTIYVGSWIYLYAINPNGTEKWKFQTSSNVNSSPAIGSDGTIYVGSYDSYLYALNPDGTQKWKFQTSSSVDSSPAIGSDETIYVGSDDNHLYAINPDGTQKWKLKTSFVISSAIGSDGTIYVGSSDRHLYAINPDGTIKWKFQTGGDVYSSPAIDLDGTIYVGSTDYYLYAINPDGTEKWKFPTGFYVNSSPTVGFDRTIYVGARDNYLYAINPNGTMKWRFPGGWVIYSPAIGSDGTVYFGSVDDYLYAINSDSMGLANSTWPKFHHDNQNTGRVLAEPDIAVTPPSYDYGNVKVGKYTDNTFVVKNEGTVLLSVSSTTLVGDDVSEFSIQSGGGSFDLNPNETRDVVVRFEPQSFGDKKATLRFISNDPNENQFDVTLSGTAMLLMWKFQTGYTVSSSPAVGSDETIYVGSYDNYLYAINPDGTQKWKFQTGGGVYSSPAVGSDGTIYVGSNDYYLYAINPEGTLKWKFQTGNGVYSSPSIDSDGTIYVGSNDYYLYAINPDGTMKWEFQTGWGVSFSPAIGSDGTIYVMSGDNLYAINPDGTMKWEFQTGWGVSPAIGSAIGSDGTIYVGSVDKYLYAINPDGTMRWKFQTGGDVCSSPAIGSDETIYVGSYDKYLYAINPDGTQKWKFQTGDGVCSSPAIGSDGTIYVGSNDYYLYAINPNGTQEWKFQTGFYVFSSPAIGLDGTIYVGSYDYNLYAINSESFGLADSNWPKFHHDRQNTGRVSGEIPLYGDVTGDGSVTALDAAVVLQACVGLVTLTPEQEERADVSGENGVTAYDASLILRYVVGLIEKFPVEGDLATPANNRQNYTLSIGKVSTRANERIVIPISIDDAKGILSGKLSLTYNAEYLNPIDVRIRNRVFPKNSVSKYNVRDGVLEISFANSEELRDEVGQDGNYPLLSVEFEARNISTRTIPLTLSEAYLNERLNTRKVDGWVKFIPETNALLPNFPNPFNPDTWIPYQLTESATVVIRIYNVSGQLVRLLDIGYRQAGFYIDKMDAAYWDGRNESGERVASGVYFYQLEAGKFSSVRKMTIIK